MLLAALDAMDAEGVALTSHIKLILDGREEQGSPGLADMVLAHRERLAADYLLVIDGPQDPDNQANIVYGCRGIATAAITTFGPQRPQHSGHYGNVAPNPAL